MSVKSLRLALFASMIICLAADANAEAPMSPWRVAQQAACVAGPRTYPTGATCTTPCSSPTACVPQKCENGNWVRLPECQRASCPPPCWALGCVSAAVQC